MKVKHIIKVEVNTAVKLGLIQMASQQKRSLKRQCEFILEKESHNYGKKDD